MFGAQAWKRRAMASIASRSPARDGLTCAQTKPRLPELASKWG